ncbi:MAG: hypothetical protein D6800_13185, partial [Candidatus Zixiibacteriota bacterium]
MLRIGGWCVLILGAIVQAVGAQATAPDTMWAVRVNTEVTIGGFLDSEVWQNARWISDFTQRELHEGQPATERTEAAVLYNQDNLYIGVRCWDSDPEGIVAQKMKRDFDFQTEDDIEIVIDTYHDARNGYLFVTNPLGARADILTQDNGRRFNMSWDGVWDVETRRTDKGWAALFVIPFSTLKFSSDSVQVWGTNFERNIRRKREQVRWQGWTRDARLTQVSRAGVLVGLRGLNATRLIEFKPYSAVGLEKDHTSPTSSVEKFGGDINFLVTPTMKLNLTLHTDFAQAESDRAQVNLTRFSLFFPEKREFFLEGADYFNFGLGH